MAPWGVTESMTTVTAPVVLDLRGGAMPHASRSTPEDRGDRVLRTARAMDDAPPQAALREVYDAHYGRLAGWTGKLVGDPDLAHDLATEAFVKLVRSWSTIDEPRAWLYATTANLVRDHWRRRGREQTAYGKVGLAQESAAPPDLATRLTVRDAVLALPDRLRVVVLLHYFADLTVAQIATHLGKAEGTVKRDLFDARHRMALLLEGVR